MWQAREAGDFEEFIRQWKWAAEQFGRLPAEAIRKSLEDGRGVFEAWLGGRYEGLFEVDRAYFDGDEQWLRTPGLLILRRVGEDRRNELWPVLRCRVAVVPGEQRLLVGLEDHRFAELREQGEERLALFEEQAEQFRQWFKARSGAVEWDGRRGRGVLVAFQEDFSGLDSGRLEDVLEEGLRSWLEYEELVSGGEVKVLFGRPEQGFLKGLGDGESEVFEIPDDYKAPEAVNLIFSGPPGTGKTYRTVREAVLLCDPEGGWESAGYEAVKQRYEELRGLGRIGVVTFHQSYGYEEFVEGIRPVLLGEDEELDSADDGEVRYRCERGIFKELALLAGSAGLRLEKEDADFEVRWQALLQKITEKEGYIAEGKSGASNRYRLSTTIDQQIRLERVHQDFGRRTDYLVPASAMRQWWDKRGELGEDFQAITTVRRTAITGDAANFTPKWILYRELHRLTAEELAGAQSARETEALTAEVRVQRAQKYLNEGKYSRFYHFDKAEAYVLIIDEINRGNMSRILGELITLLEPTKRLTCPEAMVVSLPYSKDRFGVPPNLHIVGTMNTADRSIALMDVALRRRFEFEEVLPDWRVVRDVLSERMAGKRSYDEVEDVEVRRHINLVVALMETVNERICFLYDREHQIGHSYFLNATDLLKLRDTFALRVIPLLQEYFYDSWERLCQVLGCPYDEQGRIARMVGEELNEGKGERPIIQGGVKEERAVLLMEGYGDEAQVEFEVDRRFLVSEDERELWGYFTGVLSRKVLKKVEEGIYIEGADE